jgi:hypothetical protein
LAMHDVHLWHFTDMGVLVSVACAGSGHTFDVSF